MPIESCKLDNGGKGFRFVQTEETTTYAPVEGKCFETRAEAIAQARAVGLTRAREAGYDVPEAKEDDTRAGYAKPPKNPPTFRE